jgi:SAM-dependent methyltransferase
MGTCATNLESAVAWRPKLWASPCRFVIGDPSRFRWKRVLDLGSRDGSMARYFESLGAEVEACDVNPEAVDNLKRSGLTAFKVDKYWDVLADSCYDFIFTKSVLVLAPKFIPALTNIRRALRPGGEYLAVENWTSPLLEAARFVVNRRKFSSQFSYLNPERLGLMQSVFAKVSHRFGPLRFAVGIRAV